MSSNAFAFVTALIVSLAVTPVVRQLALRLGVVDRPSPRKVHLTPMPLLGGLAIYIGTILAILFFVDGSGAHVQVLAILSGASLLVLIGILDDLGVLHHQIKLFVGMPAATLMLLAADIHISLPLLHMPAVSYGLTALWVIGITASFSILDHMDGLCAGIASIASLFLFLVAALNGQVLVAAMAAATMGSSLGFLLWNFNPAKIFMGDGGAMFLGFMVATLAIKVRPVQVSQTVAWMIPILILGVPIFDTTLVTISRARRGLIPFASPGKDHTAHRLADLGLGQRGAVLVLYAAGTVFGCTALMVGWLAVWQAYLQAAFIILASFLGIVVLERASCQCQDGRSGKAKLFEQVSKREVPNMSGIAGAGMEVREGSGQSLDAIYPMAPAHENGR